MPYFRGRYVTEEEHTRLEQDYLNRVKMELDRLEYDRIKANWDQLDEQQRLEELEQKYDDDLNFKEDLSAEETQDLDQDEQLRQHQEDAERIQEGAQREQEARARKEDEARLEQAQEQETEQVEVNGEAQNMDRTSFDAMADEADQREAAAAGLQDQASEQAEESEELDLTPDENLMDEERQRGARL